MLAVEPFTTDPHPCAYLGDRQATLQYSFALAMEPQEYEDLMNAGYRKFGMSFFRPVCIGCNLCRPIRLPVADFRPDRSQRRTWKRNQDLRVQIGEPVVDDKRLELYAKYHYAQADNKGWPRQEVSVEEYSLSLVENPIPTREISLWDGSRLLAVIINDFTPQVLSAVYHFYDPDLPQRGLGTYAILQTIELARRMKKRWVYLGYYVSGSRSMEYKARFRPYELMDASGNWHRAGLPARTEI